MFGQIRRDILLGISLWAVVMTLSTCVSPNYRDNVKMKIFPEVIVIQSHNGGFLQTEINFLADVMASGKSIRIEGGCHSACTILLSYDKTCVGPGAYFGFHSASYKDGGRHPGGTLTLMKFYPTPILIFFVQSGAWMKTDELTFLTGPQVISMLDNACTD